MQPQAPYQGPPPPTNSQPPYGGNQAPAPDYSFLNEQPKKHSKLPSFANSFVGKIFLILFVALIIIIILIIVKSIVSPAPFNKADYEVLIERQNEMVHIVKTDVTNTAQTQLTQADQNFAATTDLALTTAQSKTVTFLKDYGEKINLMKLEGVYDSSIDQTLSNSITTNSFDSTFRSVMQQQLQSYQQELKTAYASSRSASGKSLILSEYKESKQLLTALNSSSS